MKMSYILQEQINYHNNEREGGETLTAEENND